MNIEQYPLLQYIIKKYTYIYNSEGLIIFDIIGYYYQLICMTTSVPADCVKELRWFDFYLKGLGLFPLGYWCSKRCWYTRLLNVTMVFEFLILIVIEFHSFASDTETTFCPTAVLR